MKLRKTRKKHRLSGGSQDKWLIVQYDDRPLSETDEKLLERNREYAKKHGYDHIFISEGYNDIPAYWRKVKIVQEMLNRHNKGVMWLDTDAVIHDMNRTIDSFYKSEKGFIKAIDIFGNNKFNAGVWIIKNTPKMKELMEDWMKLYKKEDWKNEGNGKWSTHGAWAGNVYEQGSFAKHITGKHEKNINTVSNTNFHGNLSNANGGKNPFILHFLNFRKPKIAEYVKKYLSNVESTKLGPS
jgi:hypothetical protein